MSADRLRQAAQKIRDTANHATDGEWTSHVPRDAHYLPDVRTRRDGHLQEGVAYQVDRSADAAHIALWSPPVALAVADLLDYAAGSQDVMPGFAMLADSVADLILGGAA